VAGLELVTIEGGGRRLAGVLEWPAGRPCGGVVIVHGWGGCRVGPHRILVEAARHLNGLGFATLRFDLGGRGESGGAPLTVDLDSMIDDAAAAVDALRGRLAGRPVALLGMCSGGNVALATAALRDDVAAVAAWSTYPFQEQRTSRQDVRRTGHFLGVYVRKAFRLETWRRLVRGRVNLGMVRRVLFGHAKKAGEPNPYRSRRDVLGPLAHYEGRVLFVFGGNDPEAADAREMFSEFCREHGLPADFEEVAEANHNFYSLPWKRQVIETTGRWLAAAMAG